MTHGESIYGQRTPEYCAWVEMIKRCTATSGKHWMKYGGRGIVVCDRWRHSYETFLADMGRKPSPRHSLDRRDNDGIYEPSNCRWATSLEQNNNRRNNIRITYKKKLITASEASAISGIPYKTMVKRILSGWSPEDAMERPLRRW